MEYKVQAMACFVCHILHLNSPICIYNPSLGKYVTLPMTNISCRPLSGHGITLAFGFHPGVDKYKVARMVSFGKDKLVSEVEVCSTRSWNRVDVIPRPIKSMKWDCGYGICNGVAYWTMANQRDYLVLFDASNKIFQALPPPK
ncbi:unnamed protein product [Prunus brigantina]